MQFVSKNFKCDTCWSSLMEDVTFPIASDDKQPIYCPAHQFAELCVSLAWRPGLSTSPTTVPHVVNRWWKTNGLTETREAEGYMHGQILQHVVSPHHCMAKKNKWAHRGPRSRRIHARTDPTARCPSTSLDGIRSRHHCIIQCAVRPHFLRRQLVEQSKVSRKVLELPQFALSLRRQHPKMHKTEKQSWNIKEHKKLQSQTWHGK